MIFKGYILLKMTTCCNDTGVSLNCYQLFKHFFFRAIGCSCDVLFRLLFIESVNFVYHIFAINYNNIQFLLFSRIKEKDSKHKKISKLRSIRNLNSKLIIITLSFQIKIVLIKPLVIFLKPNYIFI